MGPLPRSKSGFQYIVVIQDLFTKWIECVPLRSATGKKIKNSFLEILINRWGTPRVIHTDNGTEFINKELKSLTKEFNIVDTTSPPYHPQANPVERVNRVLKTMIVSFIGKDHRSWNEHLSDFRFAYNTAFHSSLKTTPAFLNFVRDPKPINSLRKSKENIDSNIDSQAIELWNDRMKKIQIMKDWVIKKLDKAYQKQSHNYNLRRREVKFSVGDLVLTRSRIQSSKEKQIAAKLNKKFVGPFRISKVLSPIVYQIIDDVHNKITKAHVQDLKPYIS